MALINTYKIYSSILEKIKNKKEVVLQDLEYDIYDLNNAKERKIERFIQNSNDELYLNEIVFQDIDKEVNKRLIKAMNKYNKKDYWLRREAIQKWRSANKTEEASIQYKNRLDELDKLKKEYELTKKQKIRSRLESIILTDIEAKKEKMKEFEVFKQNILENNDKFIKETNEKYESLVNNKKEKCKVRVAKLDNWISKLENKLEKNATSEYQLDKDIVLEVSNLTMQFGGLKAVDNLSFKVKKGEVFGLIGPNGAGKTTVFNCITQFYKPTKGTLYFQDKHENTLSLTDYAVHNVIKKGIVRTFQNVEVIKEISVLDNLLIAAHTQYKSNLFTQFLHLPKLKKEEKQIRRKAYEVLEFMGLTSYANWLAWGLPYGILKKIEIARTLMNNPQLIILDEPAAGLNDSETADLTKLIRRIQEKYNCSILLVEHDMGLVMDICDTICAISFGKLLAIGNRDEIQANKEVQAAYLGTVEEE